MGCGLGAKDCFSVRTSPTHHVFQIAELRALVYNTVWGIHLEVLFGDKIPQEFLTYLYLAHSTGAVAVLGGRFHYKKMLRKKKKHSYFFCGNIGRRHRSCTSSMQTHTNVFFLNGNGASYPYGCDPKGDPETAKEAAFVPPPQKKNTAF